MEVFLNTPDSKEYFGIQVDLSRNEVISALRECEILVSNDGDYYWPYIVYNGTTYRLGRTDLFDNIATGIGGDKTVEEWRSYYLNKAKKCYGGRLQNFKNNTVGFSVIDSVTDG